MSRTVGPRTQHRTTRGWIALGLAAVAGTAVMAPAAAGTSAGSVTVELGVHAFGQEREPDGIVAHAGPDVAGFVVGQQADSQSPASFQVTTSGEIWVLDAVHSRILVWAAGRPLAPARTVPLASAGTDDFAVDAHGRVYSESVMNGPPMVVAYTATGTQRWMTRLADQTMGTPLRVAADGVVYQVVDRTWTPLTTVAGASLTPAQQTAGRRAWQPVGQGRRLSWDPVSDTEYRVRLTAADGTEVRSWRVRSGTDLHGLADQPALVGEDLVLVLRVGAGETNTPASEFQVVRISPSGTVLVRFAVDGSAAWGSVTAPVRVGPDDAVYTLRSSQAAGVSIGRYSLNAGDPASGSPATTTAGAASSGVPSGATSATPTAATSTVDSAEPEKAGSGWLVGVALTAGLLVLAAAGGALWYRRGRTR